MIMMPHPTSTRELGLYSAAAIIINLNSRTTYRLVLVFLAMALPLVALSMTNPAAKAGEVAFYLLLVGLLSNFFELWSDQLDNPK